jgi:phosphoribosylaminoimidazole-succinocarboxamide synthase
MLCHRLDIIMIETIVRNVVAGSLAKRTGLEEARRSSSRSSSSTTSPIPRRPDAQRRPRPDAEARDADGSRVDEAHGAQDQLDLETVSPQAARAPVDFKLEFGRHGKKLMLGDEISPDTCRLWDSAARRSSTRIASVATWAASRKRTRRCIRRLVAKDA